MSRPRDRRSVSAAGRIEELLAAAPGVERAMALPLPARAGAAPATVAYVTGEPPRAGEGGGRLREQQRDKVDEWRSVFDDTYRQADEEVRSGRVAPQENTSGWISRTTGEPIPAAEMRQWVDGSVARIAALAPRRVLELGCGSGLLLFRLLGGVDSYLGTDLSPGAIEGLRRTLADAGDHGTEVALSVRGADDFQGVAPRSHDLVILSSVVQYFPSLDYLLAVLRGAAEATADGGAIYLADLRCLPLLPTLTAAVELAAARRTTPQPAVVSGPLPVAQLRHRIARAIDHEEELLVDPALLHALAGGGQLPRLSRVRILPRRGRAHNELTRFRFDALLEIGPRAAGAEMNAGDETATEHLDDKATASLDLPAIERLLRRRPKTPLLLDRLPNARLREETALHRLLERGAGGDLEAATVDQLAERAEEAATEAATEVAAGPPGVDPEKLLRSAAAAGYRAQLDFSDPGPEGRFSALLHPAGEGTEGEENDVAPEELRAADRPAGWPPRRYGHTDRPLAELTNDPLAGRRRRGWPGRLRRHLAEQLPTDQLPLAIVRVRTLPSERPADAEHLPWPDPRPAGKPDPAPERADEIATLLEQVDQMTPEEIARRLAAAKGGGDR